MPRILRPHALLLAALCVAGGARAATLTDSFETPVVATTALWGEQYLTFSAGQSLGAWSVLSGNVDLKDQDYFDPAAPSTAYTRRAVDGEQFVDLNGSVAGWMQRAFTAEAGSAVTVSFWYSGNPYVPNVGVDLLANFWVGTTAGTGGMAAAPGSFTTLTANRESLPVGSPWTQALVTFVAPASTLYLNFRGIDLVSPLLAQYPEKSYTPYGILVDDLRVTAVPEPSTWALMLAGLGILAGTTWRGAGRTSRQAAASTSTRQS